MGVTLNSNDSAVINAGDGTELTLTAEEGQYLQLMIASIAEPAAHPDLATHDALGLATDTGVTTSSNAAQAAAEATAAAALVTHAGTPHGGAHPDLTTHDALGLATDAELTTHAATAHGSSVHEADTLDAHDASAISILDAGLDFTATDVEGALAELQADNEASHHSNANDHAPTNDHVRDHSVTSASDHDFPGGTTTFLRADGTFAVPTATAADPVYSPGSFTVATETGRWQPKVLKLTGSQRATIEGTGRLVIS